MSIYDELQQEAFASVYEKSIANLIFNHSWFSRRLYQAPNPA
ncbi:uncharacterized protein METZ01_LOCUS388684 [marine metagenome]|uniref:Uncharacterized protein n=1 Tax=marine metagenome TaxID=408172 RepID=A0A382UNP1_9ZZZZ